MFYKGPRRPSMGIIIIPEVYRRYNNRIPPGTRFLQGRHELQRKEPVYIPSCRPFFTPAGETCLQCSRYFPCRAFQRRSFVLPSFLTNTKHVAPLLRRTLRNSYPGLAWLICVGVDRARNRGWKSLRAAVHCRS